MSSAWKEPKDQAVKFYPESGKTIPLRNISNPVTFPKDPKEVTEEELLADPRVQRIIEQKRIERAAERQAAQEAADEAARARSEEAQIHLDCVVSLLDKYESQRLALHATAGAIWRAADTYEKVAGHPCPALNQKAFLATNLPPLDPNSNVSSTSTTRVSVLAYQQSLGKTW